MFCNNSKLRLSCVVAFALFSCLIGSTRAFLPPRRFKNFARHDFGGSNDEWKQSMNEFQRGGRGIRQFLSSSSNNGLLSRRNVISILGGTILGVPLLAEAYSRAGAITTKLPDKPFPNPASGSWENVKDVTLVFHGAAGLDKYTDELMQVLAKKESAEKYHAIVDWTNLSNDLLQASFNGQRVGRDAATQLLSKTKNLNSVHLIGISVGAFAADATATQIKKQYKGKDGNKAPYIQLTLLDPFCQRGVISPKYGNSKFGASADYTQQFMNTDDPVPFTNTPVKNAVCTDVTALRPSEVFGHDWPLAYYSRSKNVGLVQPQDQFSPGTTMVATKP